MRRREFIALVGSSVVAWPLAARAQQPERMRRVGLILPYAQDDPEAQSRVKAFRYGLRDVSWVEGRNIRIDYRFSGIDPTQIKQSVAEMVSLAPDLIVANTVPVLTALRQATSTIPIVFTVVNDPVGLGFVSSLARPGGNITGFSFIEFSMVGKWIGILKDIAPDLSRVALMFNPDTAPYYDVFLRSFERQPRSVAVEVSAAPVRDTAEIEQVIARLAQQPSSGLIAASDAFVVLHRDAILNPAKMHRVPVISGYRQFVLEGSLISYGPDPSDIFRRTGLYVDRILHGEKPADLPVQAPTKYELVVNLKTAKALGLQVPDKLVALADEVIE